MSSKDYLVKLIKGGFLKKENIGLDKVKNLLRGAEKDLRDAKILYKASATLKISEEPCYNFAYNSMLKIARAVLFLNKLRPDDGRQHKTTIEAAGIILGGDFRKIIAMFDKMRKKRNQFTYDPVTRISKKEAESALEASEKFFHEIKKYINRIDPQLKLF